MSDLKEFLDKESFEINEETSIKVIDINDLGLFFWDRGGKEWAWMWDYNLKDCILQAKQNFRKEDIKANAFLNCLACLEENKVKELIKKEGVVK